jgi:K+-transporting ATPase ATPase C chain
MEMLITSLRITVVTMSICVAAYTAALLGVASVTPETAAGSLIVSSDGNIVGSRLIAQSFTEPRYFWPRPSAVEYDGAGAGGSNKSPTSDDLAARAGALIARHGASTANPLPADLATASGSGLDPHISERAARYQVDRIAQARGLAPQRVGDLVEGHVFRPGSSLTADRLVNVLELNLALDALESE